MATKPPKQYSLKSSKPDKILRSLSEYLTELGICSNEDIAAALEDRLGHPTEQDENSLAATLLESGRISQQDLDKAYRLRDAELLSSMSMFRSLPCQFLADMVQQSQVLKFSTDEIVFRQGEASLSAYVILSGMVSLSYRPETGHEINIQTRSCGEVCGEMSLLADSEKFMTARAVVDSRILVVPKDMFLELFQNNPLMFKDTVKKWCLALVDSSMQAQAFRDQYYSELFSAPANFSCSQLHGNSRQATELRNSLDTVTGSDNPILLLGEKGTLKTRVAQHIYKNSSARDGPFIIYDTTSLPSFITRRLHVKISEVPVEQIQLAALLGELQGPAPGSEPHPWQGFLTVAGMGMLVIENCQELHPTVQRVLTAYIRRGSLPKSSPYKLPETSVRLVFAAEKSNRLDAELRSVLTAGTIYLPTLRSRKKDLKGLGISLVEEISRRNNGQAPTLDQEAVNKIMAYKWPGNFKELEDVLQRAVSLKRSGRLSAEDIFIGKVTITGKNAYNLMQLPLVKRILGSPFYPRAFQFPMAFMFLFVIALGIWGKPTSESNISLLLVWANWEPLLIISCIVLARIWCSFCPVGVIAEQFRKIKINRKSIPARKMKNFFYLGAFSLAVVFWSQSALNMWERPRETAGLLLAMLVLAILFALVFEGRVWCRYVCPLGQMIATFARLSVMEVRSNYHYCSHECSTYDCSTGKNGIPGCRMAQGPFAMENNQNCILCGDCIKNCPHQSVRFNLRAPGWELWNAKRTDLAAILFIPLLWGTQIFREAYNTSIQQYFSKFSWPEGLTLGVIMALSILFAYHVAIAGIAFMGTIDTSAGRDYGSIFIYSMLPLVYSIEIAIRLVPLLNHAADFFRVLGNQIGYSLPQVAFRLDMQSIYFLQVVIICAGLFFSLIVSTKQTKMFAPEQVAPAFFRFLPLFVIAVISITLL